MKKAWWAIKCLFGFGHVKDGSICWFSDKFFDVHDYHSSKGGDGIPSHFHVYRCSKCFKVFEI
jgi:hypothetical protein